MSYGRRGFAGGAVDSTLTAAINATDVSFTAEDLTGWPDGSTGKFLVIFDHDQDGEEHALGSSRSGNTVTFASSADRGIDGTAAVTHAATTGTVRHGLSKIDVDEANYAVSQTVGQVAAKGDLLVGSAANTLAKLAVGSTGQALLVSGGTLGYGDVVTPAGTQTLTNKTITGPTIFGYTEQVTANASSGAAVTYDATAKNVYTTTLTGNVTVTLTAGASGTAWSLSIVHTQDAAGGRTATWPASVKWPNGVAPSPATTANAVNIYTLFTTDGGTTWFGFLSGRGMA